MNTQKYAISAVSGTINIRALPSQNSQDIGDITTTPQVFDVLLDNFQNPNLFMGTDYVWVGVLRDNGIAYIAYKRLSRGIAYGDPLINLLINGDSAPERKPVLCADFPPPELMITEAEREVLILNLNYYAAHPENDATTKAVISWLASRVLAAKGC